MIYDSVRYRPTIRDLFQMPIVGGGGISPNGDKAIYRLVRIDDFEDNQVKVHWYIYDSRTAQTHQLTKTKMISEVRWLNNETVALMKRADNSSIQIYVFERLVGEGSQITDHPGGIDSFEPFGNGFIYIAQKKTNRQVAREKKYGNFIDVEEEESGSALYYVDRKTILEYKQRSQHSSSGASEPAKPVVELSELLERPFKIESAIPSPRNDAVFINCRSRDDFFYENETYCLRIEFDTNSISDDEKANVPITRLTRIALPKGARIKAVSPDGGKLLVSYKENNLKGRAQADLWLLDLSLIHI